MRAATEGNLPSVMPQGNLVEVLGREVRQGSPGELMVESSPSRQRRPPCTTNKEMSDEAADAAALTYLLTPSLVIDSSGTETCEISFFGVRTFGKELKEPLEVLLLPRTGWRPSRRSP